MDGTLLDSESMYQKIVKEICANHGEKYTKAHEAKLRGATDREISEFLVTELKLDVSVDKIEEEIINLSRIRLPHSDLKKGAARLLHHLHDTGIPFALVTNSTRPAVRQHVATKPDIFSLFHHMVCVGDADVDRGKPHPDIYLVAASKFQEKPKPIACLVFEDSLVGLKAAYEAGMQVVMTPQTRLPPTYAKRATLVLKSLLDFKPESFGLPSFIDVPEAPRKTRK